MRPRLAPLALLLACLAPASARASFGTEFWLVAPESQAAAGQPMSVVVSNANAVPVDISLEDVSGILLTDTVAPRSMTVLRLIGSQITGTDRALTGLRLTASAPVGAALSSPDADQPAGTRGVTTLIPALHLGTRHRPAGWRGASRILVVALEDGTSVRFTPSADVAAGFIPATPAGTPIDVTLARFEAVQFASDTTTDDFTGSLLASTSPVAVFCGSPCAQVPLGLGSCDHVLEQAPPVSLWGQQIIAPQLPDEGGYAEVRRVLVDQPNTRVLIGPSPVFDLVLQPDEVFEFAAESDVIVTSDKPIELVSYATEFPSMLIHSPTRLHGTTLAFGIDAEDAVSTLVIAAPVGATVQVDGNPVAPGAWTLISAGWQRAVSLTSPGFHVITSDLPVGAFVFGGSPAATRAFAVPAADAVPTPLICEAGGPYRLACQGEIIRLDGTRSSGTPPLAYAWSALSPGVTIADPSAVLTDATFSGAGPWSVQLTVTDAAGMVSCAATVLAGGDVDPPDVACPATITAAPTTIGSGFVAVGASATDACDPAPVLSNDRTAGGADASDTYPCGETVVTFTAIDASGNRGTCATRVVVTEPAVPEELSPRGAAIPLRVFKFPAVTGSLKLTHAMPLGATSAVNIYRGTIPARAPMSYDHVPLSCAVPPVPGAPGLAEWTMPPDAPGSAYFLVSASNCAGEGSRGQSSDGSERPALPGDCGAVR